MPYIWAKKLLSIGEQIVFFHCIRFSYILISQISPTCEENHYFLSVFFSKFKTRPILKTDYNFRIYFSIANK